MERKWVIAIAMIAIVVVGFSGWYFLYGTQKAKPVVSADVTIDNKDYTMPINWTLTAVPGATNETSHTIINKGTNATSMAFNVTIWHLEGNQWTQVWNGTKWFNGTSWVDKSYAAVQASILVAANQTVPFANPYGFANKSFESSTYYYSLTYNDKMIYLSLNYLGSNPTVDGQTVFTYVAFDNNGNGVLDASDKAFNFTINPNLPTENDLKIYTPSSNSSWNATPSWNGSISSSSVPITVLCSSNGANITFAIPFSYIGAQMGGKLGFVLQAFSHDWTPSTANATTPSSYMTVSLNLPQAIGAFPSNLEPNTTQTFYIEVSFTSAATGKYSIVFKFQATVQNSS
jgi:hypothetical protein